MWINVKDFATDPADNAVGDGTNDDTDAIELAISYAQAQGSPDRRNAVYFPEGTYRITRTLEVYHNQGLRLIGVGNIKGLPASVAPGFVDPPNQRRLTGAVLYWDGPPSNEPLLRIKGSSYGMIENLTFVGATPQKYSFDTSTDDDDPTVTKLRFNSSSFPNVSQIYASIENFFGVEIPDWLDGLDSGTTGRLTIQKKFSTDFVIFDVGPVTGSGSWRTIDVSFVQASGTGTFINESEITLSFVRNGGTPQPYEFLVSNDPALGRLRFDDPTFGSITKIYADNFSYNGNDIGAWLDKIDDQSDVRVTVNHATHSTKTRVFKVTSVVNSGDFRTINVVPIYSNGTITDGDRIVLICSTPDPIRDRVGALVLQTSENGWPAGHSVVYNCTFLEADIGLQLDTVAPTNNCADNTIVQCSFLECGAGIKSNSIQVVNNAIVNCDFNGCDVGIDHVKGGDIRVFGASMNGYTGGTFLRVTGGGGNNASTFGLYGVRLEMKAGKPTLLKTSGAYDEKNVLIDGFSWVGPYWPNEWNSTTTYPGPLQQYGPAYVRVGNTIYENLVSSNQGQAPATSPDKWRWLGDWVRPVQLSGQTNCMMRGVTVKGPLASLASEVDGGRTFRSTLLLNDCRMSYGASDVITNDSTSFWQLTQCTDNDGAAFNNIGNWPLDPQYVITAGKAGGQTVHGGTAMSENLTLVSTLNSTKGAIILGANIFRVGPGDVARLAQYPLQFASSAGASDDVGIKRSAAGILQITNASTGLGSLLLGSSTTTNVSLTVRAIGSQSANLTNWQNSSSVTLLQVTKDGYLSTPKGADSSEGAASPALAISAIAGAGGNALAGGIPEDKAGGAGGSVLITAGAGGNAVGEGGFGSADAGAGGSIKLQPGLAGTPAGSGAAVDGEVVINESGLPLNFRVESNTDASCLVVDGAGDAVKLGGATSTRVYQNAPSTAPTDSNLGASQLSFYLDESGHNRKVRVKYADGTTLKLGSLALT